jgi:hypothetical protein
VFGAMSRFALFCGALFVLGACSKPDSPGAGAAAQESSPDAGADDPARFEMLGYAVTACTMKTGTDYGVDPRCPELKAYESARAALGAVEQHKIDAAVAPKLLAGTAPPVRALGATYLSLISGADAASSEKIADAMAKETDVPVLAHMVRSAGPAADKSERVGAAILAAAGHADKSIRFHATTILENPKIPGATAKILELAEKDPDDQVRGLACANLGRHGDQALALLEKRTADPAAQGYGTCFIGLVRQWASPPRFDTASEKAYKLTLRRIAQKPHGEEAPAFTAMTLIAQLADGSPEATAWRKEHAWFEPGALVKALGEAVIDPGTGHAARFGALDAAVKHGATKADLATWRKSFGERPPEMFTAITSKLDDEMNRK